MKGNAYSNPWKYMAVRSKKAFKASTHSETRLHQSISNNQNCPNILKILKFCQKIQRI